MGRDEIWGQGRGKGHSFPPVHTQPKKLDQTQGLLPLEMSGVPVLIYTVLLLTSVFTEQICPFSSVVVWYPDPSLLLSLILHLKSSFRRKVKTFLPIPILLTCLFPEAK